MPRKVKGVRRKRGSWQTYCRVDGEFRSETWPIDTPIAELQHWLREQKASRQPRTSTPRGTFEADATAYLAKVTALPSYTDRVRELELWASLFRGRRRRTITSAEIRGARDAWLTDGYAASTVNHRLRALSNLWTVLDGRRAPNPVRDVPEAHEPDGEPRAVPIALLQRILDAVPDLGYAPKGQPRPSTSKTKARLRLMIWTGLTHSEIGRLSRRDWDEVGATLYVTGRRKGTGGASRIVPLTRQGRAAMTAFDQAGAWGTFERSALYASFTRACDTIARQQATTPELRAVLEQLRPYDIRHSHATALYRASGDAHAAAEVLGHRSTRTTRRYIKAAVSERVQMAVDAFEAALTPAGKKPRRKASIRKKQQKKWRARLGSNQRPRT